MYSNRETIQIPKKKIAELKANSALLDTLINENISNDNNYYDNEGNFFLNRNLLPSFSDEEFFALRSAIEEGWVLDPKQREFIRNYFLFSSNLTPPPLTIEREKGYFERQPGRKERQSLRKLAQTWINMNNNNSNYNNLK